MIHTITPENVQHLSKASTGMCITERGSHGVHSISCEGFLVD